MTLTTELNRVEYSPSGADTTFAVTFVFWDLDDPLLTLRAADGSETAWTRGTQYTMTGGDGAVGTATVVVGVTDYTPASGTTMVITSALADTQDTDLPVGGEFPSTSVEQQMDKIVRMIQQHDEANDRAIHFPVTDLASLSSELPSSADRVSSYLAFNASGEPIASTGPTGSSAIPVSTFMETVLDDTTAVAARTTLGARADTAGYTSAETSLDNDAQITFAHTLGAVPSLIEVVLRANTATAQGWADNEEMIFPLAWHGVAADSAVNVTADATNVYITAGATIELLDHTSFNEETITQTEYDWVVRAWL